ncbi:MAG: ASPIC/UnbV domain-containing protein, partial [Flavobacteriaceae bacterium]
HGLSSGIGALVHVKCGEKRQTLVNQWTIGYLSNKDPRLHVGLGKNTKIDEIKIEWPDGFTEVIREVPVNQYINIVKGHGIVK